MTRQSISHAAGALAAAILLSSSAARGVTIEVGSDTVPAGETVTIEVKLNSMGQLVAGTENNLAFDQATPIVACRRNTAIGKSLALGFMPEGCRRADEPSDEPGPACEGIRAIVVSLADLRPIPDGSVLYSCDVQVADDAPLMTFPLSCSGAGSSTGGGQGLDTDCSDGEIVVEAAGGGGGGGGGCNVVTPSSSGFAWLLLAPAVLMALRRRRR